MPGPLPHSRGGPALWQDLYLAVAKVLHLDSLPTGRIWYVGPIDEQTKRLVWERQKGRSLSQFMAMRAVAPYLWCALS